MQIDTEKLVKKSFSIDPTSSFILPVEFDMNYLSEKCKEEDFLGDVMTTFPINLTNHVQPVIAGERYLDSIITGPLTRFINKNNHDVDNKKKKVIETLYARIEDDQFEHSLGSDILKNRNGAVDIYWVTTVYHPDRFIKTQEDGRYEGKTKGLIYTVEKNENQYSKESSQPEVFHTEAIKPILSYDFLKNGSIRARDLCLSPELSIDQKLLEKYGDTKPFISVADLHDNPIAYTNRVILMMGPTEKTKLKKEIENLHDCCYNSFIKTYGTVLDYKFGKGTFTKR
jgi:hypothetical protein